MRILLTGTSGQVGGALLPRLAGLGTVIAANRCADGYLNSVQPSRRLERECLGRASAVDGLLRG